MTKRRAWDGAILAFILAASLLMAADTRADPDLWGHVLFGQLILERGEIPRADPYSYLTEGHEWINHEWLSEVAFGAAYTAGGTEGIVALKVVLGLLLALGLFVHLRRRGLDSLRAGVVLALVLGLVRVGLLTARPHLFTYVLFLATLVVIDAVDRGERRWLWVLPPVMALWANLHGGFLAGLGVLALWGGSHMMRDALDAERRPRLLRWRDGLALPGILLLAAAATLANPYGWRLLEFLLRTATVARPEIQEWIGLDLTSSHGALYLALLGFVVFCLVRSEARKRPGQMVVLAVLTLLPLDAIRHLPLFALGAGVLGAEHFASALAPERSGREAEEESSGSKGLGLVVAGVVLLLAGTLVVKAAQSFTCIRVPRQDYPLQAVRFLEESGATGHLGVLFNWGEYAIWHLWPELEVSMDGRRETVYPNSIYEEHLDFIWGRDDWDGLLEKRPTDYVLVGAGWAVANLMELKPGWRSVYRDSVARVFVRDGLTLRTAPDDGGGNHESTEAHACFP